MTKKTKIKKISKKKRQKIKKLPVARIGVKNTQKFNLNFMIKFQMTTELQRSRKKRKISKNTQILNNSAFLKKLKSSKFTVRSGIRILQRKKKRQKIKKFRFMFTEALVKIFKKFKI
jgi:hypothetical protein